MPQSDLIELIVSINRAWQDLDTFLTAITPSQASKRDQGGWSVKDHVAHLAVWEDSVAVLFRGGRRHEALAIEEPFYTAASFDEINEVIRVRLEGIELHEAIRTLEGVHHQLMGYVSTLRDADLNAKAREFFPQLPGNDDRLLASLIWDVTGGHFAEHLEMASMMVRAGVTASGGAVPGH